MAVGSIVGQESVVRKTQFPRLVIPLAVVLTALFNLGAEPGRRVRVHPRRSASPRCGLAAVPARAAALLFVFTTAVSMILSALYPRFRDIGDHLGGRRRPRCSTPPRCCTRSSIVSRDAARRDRAEPAGAALRARPQVGDRSRRAPGPVARRGRLRSGCSCRPIYRRRSACSRCGCSAARRHGSPRSSDRAGRARARTIAARHDIATSVTAGICQVPVQRRVGDLDDEPGRPARRPAPARRRARRGRRSATPPGTGEQREARPAPSSASVCSGSEWASWAHSLNGRSAQPVDRPAAGADAAHRLGGERPARRPPSSRSGCSAASPGAWRRASAAASRCSSAPATIATAEARRRSPRARSAARATGQRDARALGRGGPPLDAPRRA